MQSAHYKVSKIVQNQGSGYRGGTTYQIPADTISLQPVAPCASAHYSLMGRPLVTVDAASPTGGVVINHGDAVTGSTSVNLQLVAGHPSGCTQMMLSNNGVGWTAAEAYTPTRSWTLAGSDGVRKVFAKYRAGNGTWSGVVWDSILLDTTGPTLSISPTGGTYMDTQQVALTASEPSTIRYTTDGTDPVTSPTTLTYSAPVSLPDDATIKAYAIDAVGHASAVASETYEICRGSNLSLSGTVLDATRQNAPMPLVVITLDSGQTATTNTSGQYAFTGLPRGWYAIQSVTAPKAGYVTYQARLKLCKTSLTHDITLTRDGTVYGKDTSAGYSSEGVNTSTGNFTYRMTDLAIPGNGPSFVFDRAYNSQDGANGPLGYSWTWSYNITLSQAADGEMILRWGDGKLEVWEPDGDGYKPMYGVFSTLIKNPDDTFTLKRKDLTEYRFDASNKLASMVDEYGNTMTFNYTGSNLTSINDTAGRTITFSYDAGNRITNVLDPIGRSVSFAYDGSGNLVSATDLAGQVTRYTYDEYHQLLTLTAPGKEVVLTMTYDISRGAVTCQRDALGRETRYLYDVPSKTTTIIDAEGNRSYHHFDDHLRLVQETDGRGNSFRRTYDGRGNLTVAKDKNGNDTTYAYDDRGNVLTKTEPLGRVTTATYDANNNPLTRTDALGRTTIFEYDPVNGNLLAKYDCGAVPAGSCAGDPGVAETTYTYDPGTGKLLTVTEATGTPLERTTTYHYDTFGNQVEVIDAPGNVSYFTYDGVGRKILEEHPLDRSTAYEYDAMDRLVSVTDALGGQSTFTYDVNGNKTRHLDAKLLPTDFEYDAKGRLVRKIDALGGDEEYCYDGLDRRTGVTNQRGATALIVYDPVGNVIQEIDALGNIVRHEYDPNGNRTATTDARGYRTTYVYDALNRLVEAIDPLGNHETYEYDLNGNRTATIDALGQRTEFTYDAFNRLLTVTDPEGNSTTNTYDLLGRLIMVRDARANATGYEFDALNRLVQVTDSEGGFAIASYDVLGNRLAVVDPRGNETTYTYDLLNRLVTETDPLGNAVLRSYDADGNLLSLVNADGTTSYVYDELNRVTEMTYPDLTTVTYTYDARGNRTSVTDTAGTTSYTYDLLDQTASITGPFGLTVGYTYDPDGNRNGIVYPGNRRVSYLFDALSRLTEVQDWGGITTLYTYDDAGRLHTQVMGNGVTVTYTYDEAGRLTGKTDRKADGTIIVQYDYTLDPNGNRTGLAMTQPLLPSPTPLDQLFTHNEGNQVIANNGITYTYDGKGNRRTRTDGAAVTQYTYDANNRLTRVQNPAGLWEYAYTSDGQRIASTVDGTETRYLLDINGSMEMVLAEMTSANVIKRYYIYGDGLLYSIDGISGDRLYYHYDPLGSTLALTDQDATVTDSYAYLPFGELSESVGPHENPFTYVGKFGVMQESNGLYFMRARFYDPETRVFFSEDPVQVTLDTQSINSYIYSNNSPMSLADPLGTYYIETQNTIGVAPPDTNLTKAGLDLEQYQEIALTTAYSNREDDFLDNNYGLQDDPFGLVPACIRAIVDRLPISMAKKESINRMVDLYGDISTVMSFYSIGKGAKNLEDVGDFISVAHTSMNSRLMSGRSPVINFEIIKMKASPEDSHSQSNNSSTTNAPNGSSSPSAGKIIPKAPKSYLSVSGYAHSQFRKEYRHILATDFLDQQTVSMIERSISYQIARLEMKAGSYGYRTSKEKEKAKKRRAQDVANALGQLYSQLVSALSKHQVIVRDLALLPRGATGGIVTGGVYAGGN